MPQRTCVACRTGRAKRELVRVVRAAGTGTLSVDARGKAAGRGAYVCADAACLERGLTEGSLARALEVTIDAPTRDRLRAELEQATRERARTS
ncbi:MAG: RNase P modulator RnpM [Candidatus Limnocylindria bacterium]